MTDDDRDGRDPRDPTTVSTRVWCAQDVAAAQDLIVAGAKLPPELLELARTYGPEDGGWPRWLVLGIGMRFFRQWLEQQAAKDVPAVMTEKGLAGFAVGAVLGHETIPGNKKTGRTE
jgi:hypothetical protein